MKYKIISKQNNSARCFVCGTKNPFGLGARFYELETGELACVFHTEDWHQSYPGRVHGGMTAAVLDELIGRAVCIQEPEVWGVTVELNVKYKKPVPTEAILTAVAKVTQNSRRLFEGTGKLLLPNGEIAAEAWGKYMKMPLESISQNGLSEEEWFQIAEKDPDELEIGHELEIGLDNSKEL